MKKPSACFFLPRLEVRGCPERAGEKDEIRREAQQPSEAVSTGTRNDKTHLLIMMEDKNPDGSGT
jgi:hypothetical protein